MVVIMGKAFKKVDMPTILSICPTVFGTSRMWSFSRGGIIGFGKTKNLAVKQWHGKLNEALRWLS
jgi:hypothetical protein